MASSSSTFWTRRSTLATPARWEQWITRTTFQCANHTTGSSVALASDSTILSSASKQQAYTVQITVTSSRGRFNDTSLYGLNEILHFWLKFWLSHIRIGLSINAIFMFSYELQSENSACLTVSWFHSEICCRHIRKAGSPNIRRLTTATRRSTIWDYTTPAE